jgi:hypothetical protein
VYAVVHSASYPSGKANRVAAYQWWCCGLSTAEQKKRCLWTDTSFQIRYINFKINFFRPQLFLTLVFVNFWRMTFFSEGCSKLHKKLTSLSLMPSVQHAFKVAVGSKRTPAVVTGLTTLHILLDSAQLLTFHSFPFVNKQQKKHWTFRAFIFSHEWHLTSSDLILRQFEERSSTEYGRSVRPVLPLVVTIGLREVTLFSKQY